MNHSNPHNMKSFMIRDILSGAEAANQQRNAAAAAAAAVGQDSASSSAFVQSLAAIQAQLLAKWAEHQQQQQHQQTLLHQQLQQQQHNHLSLHQQQQLQQQQSHNPQQQQPQSQQRSQQLLIGDTSGDDEDEDEEEDEEDDGDDEEIEIEVDKIKSEPHGDAAGGSSSKGLNSPLDALFQMTSSTFEDIKRGEKRKDRESDHNSSSFTSKQTSKKKRKSRTAFTNNQIYELERRFRMQKYLSPTDRDEIAMTLNLSNAQVITWFQNRRAKLKRDLEEQKRDIETASLLNLHKTFLESFQALSQMKNAIEPGDTIYSPSGPAAEGQEMK